ncbi:threonine synthase [Bacilli bacterium PM5-3]|nr:threonine synthase [Bacilli bacterium PM5-3]
MKYYGTRTNEVVDSVEAILNSFDSAKGLYLPTTITSLDLESLLNKSYQEVAFEVLKPFFDEFDDELVEVLADAYNKYKFDFESIIKLNYQNNYGYLELYHSQTSAFKDFALALYPYLVKLALKKKHSNKKALILSATSGDTGKAALESVKDIDGIEILVLYPNDGVSKIQELQMKTQLGNNVDVIAINGNFDDAQTIVKDAFNNPELQKIADENGYHLISANSINVARLLPQIVYYVKAYLTLVEDKVINIGELINISVPTGNFGNILAAYLAKLMGVPINKLICATNDNDILNDFFKTGVYDINQRKLIKTSAPSMDIIISSNLERYLCLKLGHHRTKELYDDLQNKGKFKITDSELTLLNEDITTVHVNENKLKDEIKNELSKEILLDPHTAIAKVAANKFLNDDIYTLVIASASPFKFSDTIEKIINKNKLKEMINMAMPNNLKDLDKKEVRFNKVLDKDEVLDYVENKLNNDKAFIIRVPATTANIGCAFDCAGIAVALYNEFKFDFNYDGFKIIADNGDFVDKENNMVYQTYKNIIEKYHKEVPENFYLEISSNIPIARGLGSSSTCILAGIIAANINLDLGLSQDQMMYEACLVEGHPDNVAPAFLGSMVSAVMDKGRIHYNKIDVAHNLDFYASIDPYELETKMARAALPDSIDYKQAIFNISRAALLLKAFEDGNQQQLSLVSDDAIHQQYRLDLIKTKDHTFDLFNKGDFITYWISGAGSTIMLLADRDSYKQNRQAINDLDHLDVRKLEVDRVGLRIQYV